MSEGQNVENSCWSNTDIPSSWMIERMSWLFSLRSGNHMTKSNAFSYIRFILSATIPLHYTINLPHCAAMKLRFVISNRHVFLFYFYFSHNYHSDPFYKHQAPPLYRGKQFYSQKNAGQGPFGCDTSLRMYHIIMIYWRDLAWNKAAL